VRDERNISYGNSRSHTAEKREGRVRSSESRGREVRQIGGGRDRGAEVRRDSGAGDQNAGTGNRQGGSTRERGTGNRQGETARERGTGNRQGGSTRERGTGNRQGGSTRERGTGNRQGGAARERGTGNRQGGAARERNAGSRPGSTDYGTGERNTQARRSGRKKRGSADSAAEGGRVIQMADRRRGRSVRRPRREKSGFPMRMQKKLLVLYGLVFLMFAGLAGRLIWITQENGTEYQKQVLSQQRYDSTVIPYRRGDIVDAKGTRLATSEKVYNLVIDSKVMNTVVREKQPYLEPTLQALGEHFDLDMTQIREYVASHKNSAYYVPLKQLTYDEISGFLELQNDTEKDAEGNPGPGTYIKGVWFEEEYKRIYPYNSLAAGAIGFSGRDNVGSYGLEEYYNETLNGINGREYGYLNDDDTLERTVKPAVDGYNIHTTIDANVQMIVEKYLQKFHEEYGGGYISNANAAENAACIMMWVDTGEVLAMAEYPGFNLNDTRNPQALIGSRMVEMITNANGYQELRRTDTYIDETVLSEMDSDSLYLNLNNLWKNYCITGTYEPGSTAKPFTVAAALEEGVVAPGESFECTGRLEVGGHNISCHNKNDGVLTLKQAVAKSCNVTMMKIAQRLGSEDFCKFQQIFNFGLKTNIDLAGEARTASLIYTADEMGPTDLATNSFGQNFNVTMIEMITGFCSLINGGYYYEPHMVNRITNGSGATVQNIEPRVLKQTVSETTSAYIREFCKEVVDSGTGTTARPAGYSIGGKTGTAETIDPVTHKRSETEHVVSFIGYAPADDPQIAIYVVVDRPNIEKQGQGTRIATRLVRSILTEALPYLNIYMTEELSEEEKKELEELQLEITNQYGRTPEEDALEDAQENDTPEGGAPEGGTAAPWMSYPIDPESGYRVDPETGEKYDPQTGLSVDDTQESVPDPDLPVNPNIQ